MSKTEKEAALLAVRSNAGLGICCPKPVVVDFSAGFGGADAGLLNKRCNACGGRWFGRGEDARFFTRREWNALIEEDYAQYRAEIEDRNKQFFRVRMRICETCDWCTDMTDTRAFCSREDTMAHGWNLRESKCEEHRFKMPNLNSTTP